MLNWVAVLLAVSAGIVAGRWYLTRVDALGRMAGFPTIWVALLAVLAVLAAVPGVQRRQLEQRLSEAVTEVAGRDVRVRCQALGGAFVDVGAEYGYVKYRHDGTPVSWTLIKRDQCNDLRAYLSSRKSAPSLKQIIAVHVLTHEAMHLASIIDEAAAECAAVQRNAWTARLLGASPIQASALATDYFARVYPRMPDGYRTTACTAGGNLDEGMTDAPWRLDS